MVFDLNDNRKDNPLASIAGEIAKHFERYERADYIIMNHETFWGYCRSPFVIGCILADSRVSIFLAKELPGFPGLNLIITDRLEDGEFVIGGELKKLGGD